VAAVVMQRSHSPTMRLTITTIRMVTTNVVTITRRPTWAGAMRLQKGLIVARCPHCNVQLFGVTETTDPILAESPMAQLCWKCVKPLYLTPDELAMANDGSDW
jgi:hypothetical protein